MCAKENGKCQPQELGHLGVLISIQIFSYYCRDVEHRGAQGLGLRLILPLNTQQHHDHRASTSDITVCTRRNTPDLEPPSRQDSNTPRAGTGISYAALWHSNVEVTWKVFQLRPRGRFRKYVCSCIGYLLTPFSVRPSLPTRTQPPSLNINHPIASPCFSASALCRRAPLFLTLMITRLWARCKCTSVYNNTSLGVAESPGAN